MRILVFSGRGIGDLVMLLPAMKLLKDDVPEARIDVIINDDTGKAEKLIRDLLQYQDCVSELYVYSRTCFFRTVLTVLRLRLKSYEYVVSNPLDIIPAKWPDRIMRMTRALRIGRDCFGSRTDLSVSFDDRVHISEREIAFFGCIVHSTHPSSGKTLFTTDDCRAFAASELAKHMSRSRIVCLLVGTGSMIWRDKGGSVTYSPKNWPLANWLNLADLLNRSGFGVLLLGGDDALKMLSAVPKNELDDCMNYVGRTSLGESLALIEQCDLVVGGDTGMMHCAAALGVPTLTLFGPTDPRLCAPYGKLSKTISINCKCSPCYGSKRAVVCAERKCLTAINAEAVMEAISDTFSCQ